MDNVLQNQHSCYGNSHIVVQITFANRLLATFGKSNLYNYVTISITRVLIL